MMNKAFIIFWAIVFILLTGPWLHSQNSPWIDGAFHKVTDSQLTKEEWKSQSDMPLDLFNEEIPLKITLESDFKQLIRDKRKDKYQEALLHYSLNDSIVVRHIIRIKPRGVFRKNYCSKPPLKLNFSKTKFIRKELNELGKMKMVYACKRSNLGEEYVLKEYLVYKMYNILSELSFAVRLIDLTYLDIGRKNPKMYNGHAFLIEEVDKLANRNELYPAKVTKAIQKDIDPVNMAKVALFEYMIGNTDWTVTYAHNTKLFTRKNAPFQKPIAVPYDFDYSGLVNTDYAVPTDKLSIKSVRERVYMGLCFNKQIFVEAFIEFIEKKGKIYSLINSFQYIQESTRKEMISYLDDFYKQITRENAAAYFMQNCGINP